MQGSGVFKRVSAQLAATGVLYAAAGPDPYELLDRGVAAAARLSGGLGVKGGSGWQLVVSQPRLSKQGRRLLQKARPLDADNDKHAFTTLRFAACLAGSSRPRWEKPTPASLDVFGWCSWDAMYTGE